MKRLKTNRMAAWLLAFVFLFTLIPMQKAQAAVTKMGTGPVVIYEAYGGGGNTGAIYKSDFIVLKNISRAEVNLTGWSIQYASKAGVFSAKELTGTIKPGAYYLIEGAEGNNKTLPAIPASDAQPYFAMSGTDFKVALSMDMTPIAVANMPADFSTTYPNVVDYLGVGAATGFLGTGPTPAITSSTSAIRNSTATPYTGDNLLDFVKHTPDLTYLSEPVVVPGPYDPISDTMAEGSITLDKVYEKVAGDIVTTIGQVAYIYAGSSIILQDIIGGEIVGLQIYDKTNISEYKIGDVIKVTGKVSIYGGVHQIEATTARTVVGSDTPFEPQEVTVIELLNSTNEYLSEFILIKDATLGTWNATGNTPLKDSTGTINIYKVTEFPSGIDATTKVDVKAAMSAYNSTKQIRVGAKSDFLITSDLTGPTITLPTFLPAKVLNDYVVAIDVVDNVGVKAVTMVYTVNGITSEPVVMVKDETTQKYEATVPGAKLTTNAVKLTFTAEDVNGNKTVENADVVVEDKTQIISVLPEANTSTYTNKTPEFVVNFENAGTNPKVELTINDGTPILMTVNGNTATYTPASAMVDGKVNAKVVITRTDNVQSDPYTWSFTIGEPAYKFYFGQLHAHTNYSDGSGTPDQALTYADNAKNLDFLALTDHSNYFDSTTNLATFGNPNSGTASTVDPSVSKWAYYKSLFDDHTTDEFLAIYGFEMTWSGQYGHINTFNSNGLVSRNDPLLAAKSGAGLKAYYELLKTQTGTFSQFNHPGPTFGTFEDFGHYDMAVDNKINLIEVGNGEGPVGASGYYPSYDYYTQALDKGWHLAPSNGQDNHKGMWGDANTTRTVVLADYLTIDSISDAIGNMMVYATEDNNFEIEYQVNNKPMGTILTNNPAELNLVVDLNDPDATDVIGKVSVIVNGGIVAHTQTLNQNSGKMTVTLPNDYSYYYIKVEQADGDIAVTAPVWTSEVTQVGVTSITKDTSMDIIGETTTFTTKLYNFEESDLVLTKVVYSVDGEVVKTEDPALVTIAKGTENVITYGFVPTKVGKQIMTVDIEATLNGVAMAFTKSIQLNVYDNSSVVDILIDAAHDNFYVAGDYKDNDTYFTSIAGGKGARVKRIVTPITIAMLEGVELLVLTVPYAGFAKTVKNYTVEEIAAIKDYAEKGGNIVLTSKSDRGNPTDPTMEAATISNTILAAVGAKARIADGIVVDNEKKSNEAYRIEFKDDENYNEDSIFGKGIITGTDKTFSSYNAGPVIANGATQVVKGYASTWGANYTKNFTGSAYVPVYETDEVVVAKNEVSLVTEEVLPGGGFLVTSGVTFFSNFEVTAEMLVEVADRNANFMIFSNIIDEIKGDPVITSIKEVQAAAEGIQFSIMGTLTTNSSGFDKSTAFFDSGYVQDETGGINIFPIAGNYQAGQKVLITGTTSSYQGEHQLNIDTIEYVDETVNPLAPTVMSTKEVPENLGLLVQVEGIVKEIKLSMDVVESIIVEDASGQSIRVFIDGYIGTEITMPEIKVGDTVNAIGLSSIDPVGNRIRVRDRSEITVVEKPVVTVDKSALEAALEIAKNTSTAGKTDESIMVLEGAIASAESVLLDAEATQEEVDAAVLALNEAIKGLVVKPIIEVDKIALEAALEIAKNTSTAGMTEESVKALEKAIDDAEKILKDEKATQEEVDAAVLALDEAMKALVAAELYYFFTDAATGVKVIAPISAFTKKPVLVVTKEEYNIDGFRTYAYDIAFTIDGIEVYPTEKVTLSVPVLDLNTTNLYLLYEKSNLKLSSLKYSLIGTNVEIETKDLGLYILASGTANLPATGTYSSVIFYALGMVLLLGGVLYLRKPKKVE